MKTNSRKARAERASEVESIGSAVPLDHIRRVLDYVKPSEIRLQKAWVAKLRFAAECELRPVTYTRDLTSYLSVAELAISVAQVTQVHFDHCIREELLGLPLDHHLLKQKRLAHEIVFANFEVRCANTIEVSPYRLEIELNRARVQGNNLFAEYNFQACGGKHSGHFLAHTASPF